MFFMGWVDSVVLLFGVVLVMLVVSVVFVWCYLVVLFVVI